MKTSTLILLAAGLAALYFFVLKPKAAAAAPGPVQFIPLPRVQPPSSGGTDWADLGIKYGTDLIGDTIGSLFS